MFKLDGGGDLLAGISLTNFTNEPTGIAVWANAAGETLLFITDDNRQCQVNIALHSNCRWVRVGAHVSCSWRLSQA